MSRADDPGGGVIYLGDVTVHRRFGRRLEPGASLRPGSPCEHPPGRTPGRSADSTSGSDGRGLEDATLAELHDQGRAQASVSTAVAVACFRARLAREPNPAGSSPATAAVGSRGRSGWQTWPPSSPPAAASRRTGSPSNRGRLDAVIAGL